MITSLHSGKPAYGRIRGIDLSGTIHTCEKPHSDGKRYYFCHDNPMLDGSQSPDLHGHRYSWVFQIVNGLYTCEVDYVIHCDKARDVHVDPELNVVLSHCLGAQFIATMRLDLKGMPPFDAVRLTGNPGWVKLTGKVKTERGEFEKSVEMRLSRFLRKLSDCVSEHMESLGTPITRLTDAQVEDTFNKFVAFQSGNLFRFEVLTGKSIHQGYTREKYSKVPKGTLHKSCMTDKLDFLKIYTKNPQVSLACIWSESGLEARCLLWQSEGHRLYDRIYYTEEWMRAMLEKRVSELSFSPIDPKKSYTLALDDVKFRKYPYLDTFMFANTKDSTLSYAPNPRMLPDDKYRVLRRLDGSYETMGD